MRKSELFLTLALLGAVSISLWLWLELRVQQTRNAELAAQVTALTAERSPGLHSGVVTPPHASSPGSSAETPGPTVNSPSVRSPQEAEARALIESAARNDREMLRDPAYRRAQIEAGRRQFARTRADAIRVVGMTPEQADRVIDLWVERNMRFRELSVGVPGERQSETVQDEIKRAGDAEQAEVRALLGADTYEKWGRYLATGEERAEVSQFRDQMAGSKEPLLESQADALVEILYDERERRSKEYEEYVSRMGITDRYVVTAQDRQRWLDLEKEANQRIHEAAAGVLSNSQLKSLDEMLASRLVPVEAALRLQLERK